MFTQHAKRTTVVLIGRSTQAQLPLFSRVLHLTRVPDRTGEQERGATERALRSA
jgi:hypothetical protein